MKPFEYNKAWFHVCPLNSKLKHYSYQGVGLKKLVKIRVHLPS